MAGEAKVQVSQFLDEYGLGAFQIKLITWSVLLAMIDGYDRYFGEGAGEAFFMGPYLDVLPSAVSEWVSGTVQ